MSKQFVTFPGLGAYFGLILLFFNNLQAQSLEVTVAVRTDPASATVEGRFLDNSSAERRKLSFLLSRGSVSGLGGRVLSLKLWNGGREVTFRKFSEGEYVADAVFDRFSYSVDLKLKRPTDAAHVSWLTRDQGVLMTDDLLPQIGHPFSSNIRFELPEGWMGPETVAPEKGWIRLDDLADGVFVVGKDWRKIAAGSKVSLQIHGEWLFSDDEAAKMITEIYAEYKKLFGGEPADGFQIVIAKFPGTVGVGNWEAETRGDTVLILSSDMPFRSQSLQRLHEQLRHELFHLWIPNGVKLRGNYDWFYEGFALYQSLKLAVALNRIRFEDYLDTLSRARFIADATSNRSLIEASRNRFAGSETVVYARGMTIAFLCDLAMLESSGRKRSVEDIIRIVYQKYRNTKMEIDANEAVIGVMNEFAELRRITERHIKGSEKIDWTPYLSAAGLELRPDGTALLVTAKPNGRQRALLDKLGYNNWRKLTSPTR